MHFVMLMCCFAILSYETNLLSDGGVKFLCVGPERVGVQPACSPMDRTPANVKMKRSHVRAAGANLNT